MKQYLHLNYLRACFLVLFMTACVPNIQPTQELTPLQDAYAVRDTIIIAKTALADARSAGKISKPTFDATRASFEDADKIVSAQIASAHGGMVLKSAVTDAKKKVDEAKATAGLK